MKRYIIRETTGYPTVIRNGQVVQLSLGEEFTEDELDSLTCGTFVTYICKETSQVTTKRAGETAAPKSVPVIPKAVEEPAVEAPTEVVPAPLETGSETPEA